MFSLDNIIRKNIKELTPYSSARSEFYGTASVWLDANENPYNTHLNRYPDPYQTELKKTIAPIKNVETDQVFIGNGSDEAIDLLFRAFCEPGVDKAYQFTPTYGMYKVSANINNVELVSIKLTEDFELPPVEAIQALTESKGLLFICSPNNPTGNSFSLESIEAIATSFQGLVVVDEAYIDFSSEKSATSLLESTPNLVILQTLSKAYGLAGLRLGLAISSKEIIAVINKIKPPYNVNTLSQVKAKEIIINEQIKRKTQIEEIITQRDILTNVLENVPRVRQVYHSDANFILAIFDDADRVYNELRDLGIVIRNRTSQITDALRITVGTPEENSTLIQYLKDLT